MSLYSQIILCIEPTLHRAAGDQFQFVQPASWSLTGVNIPKQKHFHAKPSKSQPVSEAPSCKMSIKPINNTTDFLIFHQMTETTGLLVSSKHH